MELRNAYTMPPRARHHIEECAAQTVADKLHEALAALAAERERARRAEAGLLSEKDRASRAEAEAQKLRAEVKKIKGAVVESATVISAVCTVWSLTVGELRHRSRNHLRASARHMAMLLMRIHCPQMSSPDIARVLGLADHTTVLYGIKRASKRIADGGSYARRYGEADAIIRGAANG